MLSVLRIAFCLVMVLSANKVLAEGGMDIKFTDSDIVSLEVRYPFTLNVCSETKKAAGLGVKAAPAKKAPSKRKA